MSLRFEFASATRIVFGLGTVKEVPGLAKGLGGRCLLVTGSDPNRSLFLKNALEKQGIQFISYGVSGEPNIESIERGVLRAREAGCDYVIGFGGGSALDAAKGIAALITNPGCVMDYLEVVGKALPLAHPPAPWIGVPTTAGTGTEVTRNSVIHSPEHGVKASIRSPLLLARVAVIDPELTLGLPAEITAATGLDALTQVVEPFLSIRANPMTDGFCREGMVRGARALRRVYQDPGDIQAREDMCVVSLMGGLSLANAGLGAVHGFAAAIGGVFPAPHGNVCAALLPHVMRANWEAVKEGRVPDAHLTRMRFLEVARLLTGDNDAPFEAAVDWVQQLCRDLRIPPLSQFGITREHFGTIIPKSMAASSMKANPVQLTESELTQILLAAL